MEKKLDLRIIKTYRALTESLKYLLTRKTLNEITVNEICERAMVRRTTFYKHFRDKYELLMFVVKEILEDTGQRAREEQLSSGEKGREFYYSSLYLFEYLEENEVLFRSLKSSCSSAYARDALIDSITDGIIEYLKKNGLPDTISDIRLELTCQFLIGALFQSIDWWQSHREQVTKYEMAEQLSTFATNAISARPVDESF
ncbi:MAG: TetR/AcrR family transcriptional regulator [Clostridiales bacterium]|nr:TetR/AcrR family transcriptional regulator [Clostridiales bacterium]